MKECELCDSPARMYCESDQASLCWDCDSKVHCANFLVARHLRNLLCDVCQSPTPWKASGGKLGPTASVCQRCVINYNRRVQSGIEVRSEGSNSVVDDNDDDFDEQIFSSEEDDEDDGDYGDDVNEDDLDQDGENQVVPWTSTPPPPASSSSSSCDASFSRFCCRKEDMFPTDTSFSSKVTRKDADLDTQEDTACSSYQLKYKAPFAEKPAMTLQPNKTSKDQKR